jgi:hypothetical protein
MLPLERGYPLIHRPHRRLIQSPTTVPAHLGNPESLCVCCLERREVFPRVPSSLERDEPPPVSIYTSANSTTRDMEEPPPIPAPPQQNLRNPVPAGGGDEEILHVDIDTDNDHIYFSVHVRGDGTWYSTHRVSGFFVPKKRDNFDYGSILTFMATTAIQGLTFKGLVARTQASEIASHIAARWTTETEKEEIRITLDGHLDFGIFCNSCRDGNRCIFFLAGPSKRRLYFQGFSGIPGQPPASWGREQSRWITAPLHVTFESINASPPALISLVKLLVHLNIQSVELSLLEDMTPKEACILGFFVSESHCKHLTFDGTILDQTRAFVHCLGDKSTVRSLTFEWVWSLDVVDSRNFATMLSSFPHVESASIIEVGGANDNDEEEDQNMMLQAALRGLQHSRCLREIRFSWLALTSVNLLEDEIMRFSTRHSNLVSFEINLLDIFESVSSFAECNKLLQRIDTKMECSDLMWEFGDKVRLYLRFGWPVLFGGKKLTISGYLTVEVAHSMEIFDEISASSIIESIDNIRRSLKDHSLALRLNMNGREDKCACALRFAAYEHFSSIEWYCWRGSDRLVRSMLKFGTDLLSSNPKLCKLELGCREEDSVSIECVEVKEFIAAALSNTTTAEIQSCGNLLGTFLPIRNRIVETRNADVTLLPRLIRRLSIKVSPKNAQGSRMVEPGDMRETGTFLALKTHMENLLLSRSGNEL